ncbi:hypothetical protein HHI36_000007 [Cryptolaemus montrouzieri]|uniref:Uncharacterized protein n=1 Tax=Cryptolaemus montrouzieri TaxID=559131 RepID=A0ABD2P3E9_9CUCU
MSDRQRLRKERSTTTAIEVIEFPIEALENKEEDDIVCNDLGRDFENMSCIILLTQIVCMYGTWFWKPYEKNPQIIFGKKVPIGRFGKCFKPFGRG